MLNFEFTKMLSALIYCCLWIFVVVTQATNTISSHSSFRKDYYLPDYKYPERFAPYPKGGGRAHIIFTYKSPHDNDSYIPQMPYKLLFQFSNNSNLSVTISPSFDLIPTLFDWIHCDINSITKQVFISLHSQSDELCDNISNNGLITVYDNNGNNLGTTIVKFPYLNESSMDKQYPMTLTWVTTMNNFQTIIIHIHNYNDRLLLSNRNNNKNNNSNKKNRKKISNNVKISSDNSPFTIHNITVNGMLYESFDNLQVKDGQHILKDYNFSDYINNGSNNSLNAGMTEGSVWTIGITISQNDENYVNLGFGGRLSKEYFVIESWPHSSQCPYPETINNETFDIYANELYLNCEFLFGGGTCNVDPNSIMNEAYKYDYKVMVTKSMHDSPNQLPIPGVNASAEGVMSLELGDEVDGNLNNTFKQWSYAVERRQWYPYYPTYQVC